MEGTAEESRVNVLATRGLTTILKAFAAVKNCGGTLQDLSRGGPRVVREGLSSWAALASLPGVGRSSEFGNQNRLVASFPKCFFPPQPLAPHLAAFARTVGFRSHCASNSHPVGFRVEIGARGRRLT